MMNVPEYIHENVRCTIYSVIEPHEIYHEEDIPTGFVAKFYAQFNPWLEDEGQIPTKLKVWHVEGAPEDGKFVIYMLDTTQGFCKGAAVRSEFDAFVRSHIQNNTQQLLSC